MIGEFVEVLAYGIGTLVLTIGGLAVMFGLSIKLSYAWCRAVDARAQKLQNRIIDDAVEIVNNHLRKDRQES